MGSGSHNMNSMNDIQIDESIRLYLDDIAERLWSGHAAVMVGAGFSKNASGDFPDWRQLGDILYEKVYEKAPSDKERYLDPLKLADEVQAVFGRSELDELICSHIPDTDYDPSPLHIRLLELPWIDVFTTNYDTLLERAGARHFPQKYDIVVNTEGIAYSNQPRIVKLHGSLPSGPFIITDEDYRQYSKKFAVFENTVRQTLAENMLCLIGFSGDDPNFLKWTGWIRDNVDKGSSPKIYLVGVLSLSSVQKKLLEQRDIVPVDLARCLGGDCNHSDALKWFCGYLSERKDRERTDWPQGQTAMMPGRMTTAEDKNAQISALLRGWRQERLSFPGWVVVPEDRRKPLWTYTQFWVNAASAEDELPAPLDLQFAFELNWRLEKCLCPIQDTLWPIFERVLHRYWPFADAQVPPTAEVSVGQSEHAHLPWPEMREMWLHLSLSMLRFYREEGLTEKWQAAERAVKGLAQHLSHHQSAFLAYESALQALFTLDLPGLKDSLKAWPSSQALPFWETKRAALLAEIGQLEEAETILVTALDAIRSKLKLKPVKADYSLVSQEAYTMLLLQLVKRSISFKAGNWSDDDEMWTRFRDRWNALKEYKCDPWNELKLFEMTLSHPYSVKTEVAEKSEFVIGRVTRTYRIGWEDSDALSAYAFLRFSEEAGAPFRIGNMTLSTKSAEGALPRICRTSLHWAVVTMIRTGDAKTAQHVFNRQILYRMEASYADELVDQSLQALEGAEADVQVGDGFRTDNFGVLLAQLIPEILSRLCCKSSSGAKRKLLRFLLSVYTSDQRSKYRGIRNLVARLLLSLSVIERYEIIPSLLQFPVLGDLSGITATELVNPFQFLTIDKDAVAGIPKIALDATKIDGLLKKASESPGHRRWAFSVLVQLYDLGLLGEDQARRLGEALWSRTDDLGLPTDTYFYKSKFLNLPHPERIDPVQLLKEYIRNAPLPLQKQSPDKGVRITIGGGISMCTELALSGATIQWTGQEITSILTRLIEWWDADKEWLTGTRKASPYIRVREEFEARFRELVNALEYGVAPALSTVTDQVTRHALSRLLSELSDAGLPCLRAVAACLDLFPGTQQDVITRIEDALVSNDHERVVDGLEAILGLLKSDGSSIGQENMADLLRYVSQSVMYRHIAGLRSALNTMSRVVGKHPDHFAADTEELTIRGLHALADDTDPVRGMANLSFEKKLEIRQASAHLAYVLFVHYSDQGAEIPESIELWRGICQSENEFAEIRNEWLVKP